MYLRGGGARRTYLSLHQGQKLLSTELLRTLESVLPRLRILEVQTNQTWHPEAFAMISTPQGRGSPSHRRSRPSVFFAPRRGLGGPPQWIDIMTYSGSLASSAGARFEYSIVYSIAFTAEAGPLLQPSTASLLRASGSLNYEPQGHMGSFRHERLPDRWLPGST